MDTQIKCFSEEHNKIEAIFFCSECKIYMCNGCEKKHTSFFKKHNVYNLNKKNGDEIFTGICMEKNHLNKLEYFCKTHNQLCCGLCITKLEENGHGHHKDCDVCAIQNIKEEKENNLKENLENIEKNINESIEDLKKILENIEKNKEKIKLYIQNIFTKIRNILNDRENEILLEIDNLLNDKYIILKYIYEKIYFFLKSLLLMNLEISNKISSGEIISL